jgi:hypothetical protein
VQSFSGQVPWDSRPNFAVSNLRLPFSLPPTTRRVTVKVFDPASTLLSQSQSHIATDSQSASKSWCRALSGTHDQIFSYLTVTVLFLWGVLSDERTGLSFVYAAGSSQRSLHTLQITRAHRLVSLSLLTVSTRRLLVMASNSGNSSTAPTKSSLHRYPFNSLTASTH